MEGLHPECSIRQQDRKIAKPLRARTREGFFIAIERAREAPRPGRFGGSPEPKSRKVGRSELLHFLISFLSFIGPRPLGRRRSLQDRVRSVRFARGPPNMRP